MAALALRPVDRVRIDAAPLVFVGYGVHAPERNWDDYKDVDLRGKVAIFLINDPDFEAVTGEDAYGKFGGKAATYYARWTYKYDEAARRGAIAALIVHETEPGGIRLEDRDRTEWRRLRHRACRSGQGKVAAAVLVAPRHCRGAFQEGRARLPGAEKERTQRCRSRRRC